MHIGRGNIVSYISYLELYNPLTHTQSHVSIHIYFI